MKLTEIASDMKQAAQSAPGELFTVRLPRGARPDAQVRVRLKFVIGANINAPDSPPEFHLQIQRTGSAPKPGTIQIEKWRRELGTFARDFGAPADAAWAQQAGETTYAAVLSWQAERSDTTPEPVEREINRADTEIIGTLPKPIRIPSVNGEKP